LKTSSSTSGARAAMASAAALFCATAVHAQVPRGQDRAQDSVALGRHIVQIAGCNDCHSPGYAQRGGKTPEASWLTGDSVGWRGPWGTTYPTNLRLFFTSLSERQWLEHARKMEPRPPMPWFNVRAMSDQELRAIYRYVKAAGPAGALAPAYVPPGQPPATPVVQFP
jgi:mono/diheme cytochrome c family protein